MVPMAEACAKCTQSYLLMLKKDKNPSHVATTFFKVMFGDDYSKVLFLPPRFTHSMQNMVGKATRLEDPSGKTWTVKFTRIDGLLAFEEGWNAFSSDHGLKVGDFLVFHYIMESHFVVLMYGQSGCPESRHFGYTRHQMKETKKKRKLITDDHSPPNVNTNDYHLSNTHSSQSGRSVCGVNERPETRQSPGSRHKDKRVKKKGTEALMPSNVDAMNTGNHLLASSSQPRLPASDIETSPGSKDKTVKKRGTDALMPTSVDAVNKRNHLLASSSRPRLPVSDIETSPGSKDKKVKKKGTDALMPSSVNAVNTRSQLLASSSRPRLPVSDIETSPGSKDKKVKKKGTDALKPSSVDTVNTSNHLLASSSRPRLPVSDIETSPVSKPAKKKNPDKMVFETPPATKQVSVVDNDAEDVQDENRRNCLRDLSTPEINPDQSNDCQKNNVAVGGGGNETQVNESGKVLDTRSKESRKTPKESTIKPSEATCTNSIKKRLRSATNLPVACPKIAKKEPGCASETDTSASKLHDAGRPSASTGILPKPKGCKLEDTKTGINNSLTEEDDDILPTVKTEPVDYDDTPPAGATNTFFSAVMSSYQHLELPEWVNLKSKVVLLRSGADLWPVLYQNKLGLKALTQGWEVFARKRGFQPGDNCEFLLVSEASTRSTCSVFRVHATHK